MGRDIGQPSVTILLNDGKSCTWILLKSVNFAEKRCGGEKIAAGNNKNNQSEYRRYKNGGHFVFVKHFDDKLTD